MPQTLTSADVDHLLATFDWDSWTPKLKAIVTPAFTSIAIAQAERAADDLEGEFDPDDPFVTRHFTAYLGARITQLDETTRDLITEELHTALEEGKSESMTDLAARLFAKVNDSAAFSPSRALMIARTETANAYNTGAIMAYRQNDIEKVEVSDGDGDEDCEEADGQVWTLDEALAEPTAHPNCVRSFAPVVGDEGDDGEEADAA